MLIDPLQHFPNCPNFQHWEAFVTDCKANGYNVRSQHPILSKTRFSPKLFNEFCALPEAEQQRIYINLCQIIILQQFARDVLGFPILGESVYRSKALNKLVGSVANNHPEGNAFDPKLNPEQLKKYFAFFKDWGGGVGIGQTQGHTDLGRNPQKRRWPYGQ